MSIFLTDPLLASLKPKPPEESPERGDFVSGGSGDDFFPSQLQQMPPVQQLGTYMPQPAQSTYDYTPQPQQPSFYQPGGAVGDVFSRFGSAVRGGLSASGQRQVEENQRAVAQGQAVGDFIGSGVRAGVDLGYQNTRELLREDIARQRLLADDPSQARWMENPFNPLVGVQSGLRANELYSNFVPPSAYESARSVPYAGRTLENAIRFTASPLGLAAPGAIAPKLLFESLAGGALFEGGAKLAGLSDEEQNIASNIGMGVVPSRGLLSAAERAAGRALGVERAALRAADPIGAAASRATNRAYFTEPAIAARAAEEAALKVRSAEFEAQRVATAQRIADETGATITTARGTQVPPAAAAAPPAQGLSRAEEMAAAREAGRARGLGVVRARTVADDAGWVQTSEGSYVQGRTASEGIINGLNDALAENQRALDAAMTPAERSTLEGNRESIIERILAERESPDPGSWVTRRRTAARPPGEVPPGGAAAASARAEARVQRLADQTGATAVLADGTEIAPAAGSRGGTILQSRIPFLPGPVTARTTGPAEVGTRVGNILKPRSLEQLGPNPTVGNVLGVADDLARQVGSSSVSLMAEARIADRALGGTVTDSRGNIFLRDVIKADGAPALKQDVYENPGRYNLTPEQSAAVDRVREIARTVRAEAKDIFKVPDLYETELMVGQGYMPRLATEARGGVIERIKGRPGARKRLAGLQEKSREFIDPLDAAREKVVYADPIDALSSYVSKNLKAASDAHIAEMLKTFGESGGRVTPAGRALIKNASDVAPLLKDFNFSNESTVHRWNNIPVGISRSDAKKISTYYEAKSNPLKIRSINSRLIPLQAIGDASSLLRQLALVLPSHPGVFARGAARSFKDAFGGWRGYEEWLASPEVREFSRSGGALMGENSAANADLLSAWMDKIPFLKQTQRQFTASSNRMRVGIWKQDVDMLARTGQRIDAQTLEQVARNANRITGVSNTAATNYESLAEFAANYMRARLETLVKATTDGGIEGALARQYLNNYISTGLIAVTGAALSQGHDPRETLMPLQFDENGRFRLNPNFGTIRAYGIDYNVFGTYSDLASMAVVIADGLNGAIREKDAFIFAGAIAKAGRSKLSPVPASAWDLISGRNIVGQETRNLKYLASRVAPIGAVQANQLREEDQPAKTQIAGGLANYLGGRANPLTIIEQLGEEARARKGSYDWNKATPELQAEIFNARPDLAQKLSDRRAGAAGAVGRLESAKIRIAEGQAKGDEQFGQNETNLKQWLDASGKRAAALREAYLEAYPDAKDNPDPKKPWEMYYAEIEKAKDGDLIDFDQVDLWRAQQSDEDNDLIDRNTGTRRTPIQQERAAAIRKLRDDKYFSMPKYVNLPLGSTDKEVDSLKQKVQAARAADPAGLGEMKPAEAIKAYALTRPIPTAQWIDAIESLNQENENPILSQYKEFHKGTLAWLTPGYTYDQIKAIPNLLP